jgi:6-phosphofructo-2-kinase/fructose-2,6-biphosphatase 4
MFTWPLFIESICDKLEIIEINIRSVKITSPDYVGWDREDAVKDYWTRINNHLSHYETIQDTELSFIKMINVGERIIVNNVKGYLQSRIMFYLMNLHISPRIIYFARVW